MASPAVNILGVLFMLCACSPFSSAAILPSVYVTVDLDMTWPGFCMLNEVFKSQIASMIFDHGIAITPGRVIIHNYKDHCSKPEENYKKAVLVVYITKHDGGHQEDVDKDLTNQLYDKLDYIWESKNQWELGPVFNGQVTKVGAGGKDAKDLPDKITEFEHTWIAIAIAIAILILIVIILTIIHYVRKPKAQVKESVSYEPRDPEHGAVINPSAQAERGQPSQISENYTSSTKL